MARCFRELADWGLIELIETRTGGPRRGGVERIFRAQGFDIRRPTLRAMPRFMRIEISSCVVAGYVNRLDEALHATAYAGSGPNLAWRPALFDRFAWRQATRELEAILDWFPQLERESLERVGPALDGLFPTVVGMACFRSPPG